MSLTVQLGWSGGLLGSAYDISGIVAAGPANVATITITYANLGSPALTPTIVNDSTFGLYVNAAGAAFSEMDIDGATSTITYTPASGFKPDTGTDFGIGFGIDRGFA